MTSERLCVFCKKDLSLFHCKSNYCSPTCRTKWHYHNRTRDARIEYIEYKRNRRRYWLNKYKILKGCEECGYNKYPEALHFDHIDRYKKVNQISSMLSFSLKRMMNEIRKCRVMCANCHAHWSKLQGCKNPTTGLRSCE